MKNKNFAKSALLGASFVLALAASAGAPPTSHAAGTFEVKTQPLAAQDPSGARIAKLSLEKQYHGDLEASGQGAMLATGSAADNGAYVALEIVTGKRKGREGSFVLQHTGVATQGAPPRLDIAIVPHSGTGELSSLSGSMKIIIADGRHSYDIEYTLAN